MAPDGDPCIARLSHCRAKTIKVRSEEKAKYFINEQKVGK